MNFHLMHASVSEAAWVKAHHFEVDRSYLIHRHLGAVDTMTQHDILFASLDRRTRAQGILGTVSLSLEVRAPNNENACLCSLPQGNAAELDKNVLVMECQM